jgi:DNA primase
MNLETPEEQNLPKFKDAQGVNTERQLHDQDEQVVDRAQQLMAENPSLSRSEALRLALEEIEGISPDILTQQRRRNDPKRQRRINQTEDWTREKTNRFSQWTAEQCCDLGVQIMQLQARHNGIALQIFAIEHEFYAGNFRSADRQSKPVFPVKGTEDLLADWDSLDKQIRVLKHMERLLAPLQFILTVGADDLPTNDMLILHFWELCVGDSYKGRRQSDRKPRGGGA